MIFRHHPDGLIFVEDLVIPLERFRQFEPDYSLPEGAIAREYVPGDHHFLFNSNTQLSGELPWDAGDVFLGRVEQYRATLFPPPTIEQVRAAVIGRINALAEQKFRELINPYPPQEALTWSYKLQEAEALLSAGSPNFEIVAPNLCLEAAVRSVTPQELASVIVGKSEQFRARCAQISGARGRHTDAVNQLQTIPEIEAYDWSIGWEWE